MRTLWIAVVLALLLASPGVPDTAPDVCRNRSDVPPPIHAFSLRLVEPEGRPVVDAEVRVVATPIGGGRSRELWKGRSSDDGTLRLARPSGPAALDVSIEPVRFQKPRRLFPTRRIVLVGPETESVTAEVDAGTTIRGRLLTSAGQPLAGVEIEVMPEVVRGGPYRRDRTSTDAFGRFEFRHLEPPGPFVVRAWAPDHAPWRQSDLGSLESGTFDLGDVRLERGYSVDLLLVDPSDRPLPGLVLRLRDPVAEVSRVDAVSSATGRVRLSGLGPQRCVRVAVEAGETADPRAPAGWQLEPAGFCGTTPEAITLRATPAAGVAGTVRGDSDRLMEALVRVERRDSHEGWGWVGGSRLVENEGAFEILGLQAGEWVVEVGARGSEAHREVLRLEPGEVRTLDLPLPETAKLGEPSGVDVRGRVVDVRGDGVVGAEVRFGERDATTDDAGRFELLDVEPGLGVLTTKGASEWLALDRDDLDVTLVRPGWARRVRGTVRGPDGGPLSVGVSLSRADSRPRDSSLPGSDSTRADQDGTFALEAWSAGTYRVAVESETHVLPTETEIRVADQDVDGVELRLEAVRRGDLHGRIVGPPPENLAGALVDQVSCDGETRRRHRPEVAPDGTWVVRDVPATRCTARAWVPGYLSARGAVEFRGAGEAELLHTFRGASVRGRVLRDGAPVAEAFLNVEESEVGGDMVPVGPDGRFEVGGLSRGLTRLLAFSEGAFARATVDLAHGDAEVVLELENHELHGFVVDVRTGAAISGARILYSAVDEESGPWSADSGEDGSFRLATRSPGEAHVVVTAPGRERIRRTVSIPSRTGVPEIFELEESGSPIELRILGDRPRVVCVALADGGEDAVRVLHPPGHLLAVDRDGIVVVPDVPGDAAELVVGSPGRASVRVPLDAEPGARPAVHLPPAARMAVVRGSAGDRVDLLDAETGHRHLGLSLRHGDCERRTSAPFLVEDLPPGDWHVVARSRNGEERVLRVETRAGETSEVRLEATRSPTDRVHGASAGGRLR